MHSLLLALLAQTTPPEAAFVRQLDATVPRFLEQNHVEGASVALIRNGAIVLTRGYGRADGARHIPATPATVFNVGSISKTVTAWGVLRLVEQGRIRLDDPVDRYLRRWHLPASAWGSDGVTIRRLLSHTAGLGTPSVHEYQPGEPTPTLIAALADSAEGVHPVAAPGSGFKYSGGGYEVLQLLIEEVSHKRFADFMREEVLLPLGMRSSTFDTLALAGRPVATPYDSGRAIPRWHYVGLAPAGLYSTAGDLARFVAAGMRGSHGEAPGRGVLSPASVALMQTPAPNSDNKYGFFYGLGYNLYPLGNDYGPLKILGDGVVLPGHMGQNTGWGAVIWSIPSTGDGFVMLTNSSAGYQAYRWALCDWLRWAARPSFGYICRGRKEQAPGPLGASLYAAEWTAPSPRLAWVDSLAGRLTSDSTPGLAVLVLRDGAVLHSAGYGLADLATGREVTEDTPFYLASLTKQLTAMAVLRLVEQGKLCYDDRLATLLPGVGAALGRVTVRQLLTHSAGVPDYYGLIRDWSKVRRLDNAAVLDSVRDKPLDFEPGSRSRYSNSGYVLLALVLERITGRPFRAVLQEQVLGPAGLRATTVLDDSASYPVDRAIGYDSSGGKFSVSDYGVLEVDPKHPVYFDYRTVGAGGIYSTLRDLARWDRALDSGGLVAPATLAEAFRAHGAAPEEKGVDTVTGYGYGWVASRRYGTDVAWHDGGFAGFRNIILRVPSRRVTVVVLANSTGVDQHRLAVAIADRLLGPASP